MRSLAEDVYRRHEQYISPNFVKLLRTLGFARVFVRARGAEIFDENGEPFWDFLSGFGSVNLGYNHPALVQALKEALSEEPPSFLHVAPSISAGLLAEALALRLGELLSVSFFCNSGAEAVEGALKLAFAATRRTRALYCQGSYHGLTLGALSMMGNERFRKPFPSLPGCEAVTFGSLPEAEQKLRTRKYAAFLVEPVQIEGGVVCAPPSYFGQLAELCRRYGAALIFDEVQTGMGRCGHLFAYQGLGVTPDILVYAKSFSGGLLPIGGFSTSPEWYRRAYPGISSHGLHASTFGGNALSCAVALKALSLIDEPLLEKVRADGAFLRERLGKIAQKSPLVEEMRGMGLLWGVALAGPTRGLSSLLSLGLPNALSRRLLGHWIAVRLLEHRFITETCTHDESVLRLEPALIVERQVLERFCDTLEEVLGENEHFGRFLQQAGGRLLAQLLRGRGQGE